MDCLPGQKRDRHREVATGGGSTEFISFIGNIIVRF